MFRVPVAGLRGAIDAGLFPPALGGGRFIRVVPALFTQARGRRAAGARQALPRVIVLAGVVEVPLAYCFVVLAICLNVFVRCACI